MGEALPEAGWCVAYGVVLHATDDGIIVEADKVRRVRLQDAELERRLVDALATSQALASLATDFSGAALVRAIERLREVGALARLHGKVTIVDRLGLSIEVRARHLVTATAPESITDCDLAIIVASREDVVLGDCLERCDALRIPALVVWTCPNEIIAVMDDPTAWPCARCALFFDGRAVALSVSVPRVKLASAAADHGRIERSFARAIIERYAAPDAMPVPGLASVWNVRDGSAGGRTFPRHPDCSCADRARQGASMPATIGWSDLQKARFTPVIALGETRGISRAAYRGARGAWPLSQDSFGIAIAAGPDARERAIGEAVERFSMLHAPADVRARARRDLDAPSLTEEEIAALLYRDEERSAPGFRFPPFTNDLVLDWSWAVRASTGERLLVPTSLVGRPPRGGTRLVDGTSNGYACHPSEEQAKLRALLELIERDALLFRWYTGQQLTRVDDVVPSDVALFLATADIDLPVVIAASCLADGSLRTGSAAATSFDVAVARAMNELEGQLASPHSSDSTPDLSSVSRGYGPRDHLAHYGGQGGRQLLEHWRASSATPTHDLRAHWPASEEWSSLTIALEAVAHAGLDVYFVDRSLPELFGDDRHVFRALVPGAVEMSWGMPYRRLASPRIEKALATGARLSSWPHPYA